MSATLNITESQIFAAVRSALLTFGLADASGNQIPVIQGQINRVSEPREQDYLVIWAISRDRLALNIDTVLDSQGIGSITSSVMNLTSLNVGGVAIGQPVYGSGVATGCVIRSQLTGTPGGTGTYAVSTTPDVTMTNLYFGTKTLLQKFEMTIQADVHGPLSGDNAIRLSTLWRDQFGVDAFEGTPIAPLYTSDPKQMPFYNAAQQFEERYVVDLCMEIDLSVTVSQQFADQLVTKLWPVDVTPNFNTDALLLVRGGPLFVRDQTIILTKNVLTPFLLASGANLQFVGGSQFLLMGG
jgi:hypothetical protein